MAAHLVGKYVRVQSVVVWAQILFGGLQRSNIGYITIPFPPFLAKFHPQSEITKLLPIFQKFKNGIDSSLYIWRGGAGNLI